VLSHNDESVAQRLAILKSVVEINIIPTGEAVFLVPLAFAVTHQNQLSYSHSLTP
jgi:hypothetical protein